MHIMAFIFASARRLLHWYLSIRTSIHLFTLIPGLLCLYLVFHTRDQHECGYCGNPAMGHG